jgi:hypothetical protein
MLDLLMLEQYYKLADQFFEKSEQKLYKPGLHCYAAAKYTAPLHINPSRSRAFRP